MSVTTIVLVGYGVVALTLYRPIAGDIAWRSQNHLPTGGKPDGGDIVLGIFFGAIGAAIWPVVIVAILTGRHLVIGAEREAKLRAREKHIRELERSLEVAER